MKFKFRRVSTAKAVLGGLAFDYCPRCTQKLPQRSEEECSVCGLPDIETENPEFDNKTVEKDADERNKELSDVISRQKIQLRDLRIRQAEFQREKGSVDAELNMAMKNYDSAFLSQALAFERRKGFLEKSIEDLKKWKVLPQKVTEQQKKADELSLEESKIRQELKELRKAAEKASHCTHSDPALYPSRAIPANWHIPPIKRTAPAILINKGNFPTSKTASGLKIRRTKR